MADLFKPYLTRSHINMTKGKVYKIQFTNKIMGETIFRDFVGDSPTTRIIEFLIEGKAFDWSLTDLATKAEVSWRTVHRLFPKLVEAGLIKQTRTIGRAKLFRLNKENPAVQKLVELFNSLLAQELERVAEENLVEAKSLAKKS